MDWIDKQIETEPKWQLAEIWHWFGILVPALEFFSNQKREKNNNTNETKVIGN